MQPTSALITGVLLVFALCEALNKQ